jgi:putative DNA primase/helicase
VDDSKNNNTPGQGKSQALAFKLLTLGFSVIPSGGGDKGKAPLVNWRDFQDKPPDERQLEVWERELSPALWGIVTNDRIAVIDADTPEARAALEAELELGEPHVISPRGGGHWYIDTTGHPLKTTVRLLPDIDVRGVGGFVNIAGGKYQILRLPVPGETLIPYDSLPQHILAALSSSKSAVAPGVKQGTPIVEGQRNSTLARMAGAIRHHGADQSSIEAALLDINQKLCQPPLLASEVLTIARSVSRYEPQPDALAHFNLTDYGNAERLAHRYGDIIRYCEERKRWLVWNGKVWEWDLGTKIMALGKMAVREIYGEAADEPDEKKRIGIANHAKKSESDDKIKAMLSLAQSEKGIPVRPDELDAHLWLFNCLNGTLDLKTGQLLPHRKEDLLTIIVPIEYAPEAQCLLWHKFLDRVTSGDTELQGYLQRAVGYSLTGVTIEQCLFLLYGLGNNGKTVFLNTTRKTAGQYGDTFSTEAVMQKERYTGGPKESLANLKGKRFIVASEVEQGRRLNVSLIKDLTGSDPIKADRKYEHEIEFPPTHKLWIRGNYKPIIPDTTLAMWRRMRLIPFTVTIPPEEVDKNLETKLEAELPGILAWAIKGCLDWQRGKFETPKSVASATDSYRQEQDILGEFIEDYCITKPKASVVKKELWKAYQDWCETTGQVAIGQRTFRDRLIERGIDEFKLHGVRYWRGIQLARVSVVEAKVSDKTPFQGTFQHEELQEKFPGNDVTTDTPDTKQPTPCPTCGGTDWWQRVTGEWVCQKCHPDPNKTG